MMIGLALGFGFLGFATQSHAAQDPSSGIHPQASAELTRLRAPD